MLKFTIINIWNANFSKLTSIILLCSAKTKN